MTSPQFPFHQAALVGQFDIFGELVKAGYSITELDDNGLSPLHWAATGKSLEAVKELVGLGANPNQKAADQLLAIHNAAQNQNIAVMQLLLELGTDIWMDGGIVVDELEELANQYDNIEMKTWVKLRRAEKQTGRKFTSDQAQAPLNDPLKDKEAAAMARIIARNQQAANAAVVAAAANPAQAAALAAMPGHTLPVIIRTNLAVLKRSPYMQWGPSEVLAFFEETRLSENYAALINGKQLTGRVLGGMHTVADWQALGIVKYGDIRKLLKATTQAPFDGTKKEYLS